MAHARRVPFFFAARDQPVPFHAVRGLAPVQLAVGMHIDAAVGPDTSPRQRDLNPPSRPARSVVNVGIEYVAVGTDSNCSADELTDSLGCATGIVIYIAAEVEVGAPVAGDPRSSI